MDLDSEFFFRIFFFAILFSLLLLENRSFSTFFVGFFSSGLKEALFFSALPRGKFSVVPRGKDFSSVCFLTIET